jgi:hypothetical protein
MNADFRRTLLPNRYQAQGFEKAIVDALAKDSSMTNRGLISATGSSLIFTKTWK